MPSSYNSTALIIIHIVHIYQIGVLNKMLCVWCRFDKASWDSMEAVGPGSVVIE